MKHELSTDEPRAREALKFYAELIKPDQPEKSAQILRECAAADAAEHFGGDQP